MQLKIYQEDAIADLLDKAKKLLSAGGGKKLESESEGGQKFLPPNPLPFCPPAWASPPKLFGGRTAGQKTKEKIKEE